MAIYNPDEIFSIFDSIKPRLNEILIKGVESISRENYSEITQLREKLEYMNLKSLNQELDSFLVNIDQILQAKISREMRSSLAENALQIITIIRLYERMMTLQIILNKLKKKK